MISNDKKIQRRIDMDMLRRSMTGVFVYAFLLPVVFWPFNFYQLEPQLSITFVIAMLLISVIRLLHKYWTDKIYRYSVKVWRLSFMTLSLCHASVLSVFFVFSIYDERFSSILHITMLAMGGICSAAVVALNPRIRLAMLNLSVLLVPSIVMGLLSDDKLPFVGMIGLYFSYIALIGVRSSKEYNRSFEIELILEQQKKELQKQSKVDALTNIYNRGYFNLELEKQWDYACRLQLTVSLLLIDVDHFKSFNDNHGHLVGDACLIHIANTINQVGKRKTDLVARFGGEEFVVLLLEGQKSDAKSLAELLRQQIENSPFQFVGKEFPVTASIGVASLRPSEKCHARQLIENADKALYAAKAAGRNCVVVHDS